MDAKKIKDALREKNKEHLDAVIENNTVCHPHCPDCTLVKCCNQNRWEHNPHPKIYIDPIAEWDDK